MFRKKQGKEEQNALVYDVKTGLGLETLKEEELKGRRWQYGNQYVCFMERDADGALKAVEVSQGIDGLMPEDLYQALFWKEQAILFSIAETLLEKVKTLGMFVLIGILILFLFLIFNSL
jgi:hypothetical protein